MAHKIFKLFVVKRENREINISKREREQMNNSVNRMYEHTIVRNMEIR